MAKVGNNKITKVIYYYLLPSIILVPLFVSLLVFWGERAQLYSELTGIILFFLTTPLFLTIIALSVALTIHSAENKLKIDEKISRLLIENRKDYGIFMLDPEGKIVNWNVGAERLLGYKTDDVMGKYYGMFFTPEDQKRNKPESILEEVRIKKQLEHEGWRIKKNGQYIWVMVTFTAVYNENKQLLGFTKLVRNATRQKEADDKLKQLLLNLEQSNRELERFAYIASHDLQEPLRMVASFTQLLEKKYKDKLDEEAREYIGFAVDGALRMQQLIIDLLTYSRVSTTGKLFSPTNCKVVLDEALFNLSVTIEEEGAKITYDDLPTIMADDIQMLQVFQNLISNAIKFHKPSQKPRIHVGSKLKNNEWIFSVQDQGIGIAPEYHEQVFLIFQRLHTKQQYTGTGIGLAICKKIIDRHGGKIWVESEPGQGAKFCFTIPT